MSLIYEPRGRAREYAELALNLYSGCTHGCLYCYAPSALQRQRQTFHASAEPRKDIIRQLERELARDTRTDKPAVLLCFTCDPYSDTYKPAVTRAAIELLHQIGYPVHVLTKGGMRASADFDLLTHPRDAFASTLTFLDEPDSLTWEPRAALPAERLEAMRLAHAAGIATWASLEPVIDPAQSLQIIRQTHEYVDLYKIGLLNYRPEAKLIDWNRFGHEAIALCEEYGVPYYVKRDLREKLL